MPATPPPLNARKNLRLASFLNVFLPGAGLLLIGRRTLGILIGSLFLVCFAGLLGLFLVGYAHYLTAALDEDILKEGRLEEIGAAFHRGWMLGFAAAGLILQAWSHFAFTAAKRKIEQTAGQA